MSEKVKNFSDTDLISTGTESLIQSVSSTQDAIIDSNERYNLMNQVYYSDYLRYPVAVLYSLGKIFQAAGQDTLGILKLLIYFGSRNTTADYGILSPLVLINGFINLSTRANKIFQYCLLPTVYWINDIQDFDYDENDIRKSYIIARQDNSLRYLDFSSKQFSLISLKGSGEAKLASFNVRLLEKRKFFSNANNSIELISSCFTAQDHYLFAQINKDRDYPATWQLPTKVLYGFLYGGCAISTVFSGATAYLSGVTLAKACYPDLDENAQIFIGSYVATCAILAYISFNLKTMRKSVTNACDSFNGGIYEGNFGIPVRAMWLTVLTTFLGVLASGGMAYFSMENAVDMLPWIKNFPQKWKDTIIFTNVIISFFPSIFNFASGCYAQIKKIISEDIKKEVSFSQCFFAFYKTLTAITMLLSFLILIDSTSNSFGTFLGTSALLEILFNSNKSEITSQILLGLSILITVSNVFLNFGMTMTGTEEVFEKCNAFVYGNNKNILYRPLLGSSPKDHDFFEDVGWSEHIKTSSANELT